jgi:hypothetical protein
MKINELLESAPRDKTRKDHNGNFLGFDPDRKVWVVIPRYDGIGMIRSGDLANGVLKHGSKYPEFSPSASPKPQMPTTGKSKVGSWIDDLSRSNKSAWDRGIDDIKRNLYKKLI